MKLNEFLANLPPKVVEHLGAYELDKAVAALPDELFKALADAVVARYQAQQIQSPSAEEIALWTGGKRIDALKALRARTGLPLKDAKEMFDRGLLINMTYAIFLDPPKP